MVQQPFCWAFAASSVSYTVGRTPYTGDQTVVRPLPHTQKSMPRVGFEPTPASEGSS
jgi:hypothetical protein